MKKQFQTYIQECQWLAEKGLFDGYGIYFAPGADAIPLMSKPEGSKLMSLSQWPWDVPAMATLLEGLGESPIKHIGFYRGQASDNPKIHVWDEYRHAVGDLRDPEETETLLKSKLFDFLILKGIRQSLYQGSTDDRNYQALLTYVHGKYTKKGSIILLASPRENIIDSDASMGEFLMGMGYEDLTTNPNYNDGQIRDIRNDYKVSKGGMVLISDNPKTAGVTSPELGNVGNNAVNTAGDFRILRRL